MSDALPFTIARAKAVYNFAVTSTSNVVAPSQAFHRWLVPIGAVAVHLCIGSVYAWSTFNRPIKALFPNDPWWFSPPYTTFTVALLLLGLSAAFRGPWVERRGPRVAATTAALFFGPGLVIGGIGLALKQSFLVFLGMGVIGGIGCGLGYIAPVSTLVKCFPDRRGMATGMAIMGFGGGAFLAGFLNVFFIAKLGVAYTVMALGVTYLMVMLLGAQLLRRPPAGWQPAGWVRPARSNTVKLITDQSLSRNQAVRTPQFYLLWGILFINVTAGHRYLVASIADDAGFVSENSASRGRGGVTDQSFQCGRPVCMGLGFRLHRQAQHLPDIFWRAILFVPAHSRLSGARRMDSV